MIYIKTTNCISSISVNAKQLQQCCIDYEKAARQSVE